MKPERIKQLRELLTRSTHAPWNKEALSLILRYARKNSGTWDDADKDELWIPDDRDASLIVEMRSSLEELLNIADQPGRDGW